MSSEKIENIVLISEKSNIVGGIRIMNATRSPDRVVRRGQSQAFDYSTIVNSQLNVTDRLTITNKLGITVPQKLHIATFHSLQHLWQE